MILELCKWAVSTWADVVLRLLTKGNGLFANKMGQYLEHGAVTRCRVSVGWLRLFLWPKKTELRWHCAVRHFVCFLLQENSEMGIFLEETHSGQLRYMRNEEKKEKGRKESQKRKTLVAHWPCISWPAMNGARTLRRINASPGFDTGVPLFLFLFFFFLFLLISSFSSFLMTIDVENTFGRAIFPFLIGHAWQKLTKRFNFDKVCTRDFLFHQLKTDKPNKAAFPISCHILSVGEWCWLTPVNRVSFFQITPQNWNVNWKQLW